jgi:hypothetical protein
MLRPGRQQVLYAVIVTGHNRVSELRVLKKWDSEIRNNSQYQYEYQYAISISEYEYQYLNMNINIIYICYI